MNARHLSSVQLQPYQELALRFALHRFFIRYPCPYHDPHEWHTECLHEARCAILCADTDEPPAAPSALSLEAEDGILLAQDTGVHWTGPHTRIFRKTLLCRFHTSDPSCPSVPPNECNLRAWAVLWCDEYTCERGGAPCNVTSKKVFNRVEYWSAGQDCDGNPCGPPQGTIIWGPPGVPVAPLPHPVNPIIP